MENYKVANYLGIIILFVGLLVMFGWFADIDSLKTFLLDGTEMKFNTALAFVISGIVICTMSKTREEKVGFAKSIFALCTVIFMLLIVHVVSPVVGLQTELESVFLTMPNAEINTTVPNLPSILTVIDFLLVAIACIFEISAYSKLKKFLLLSGIFITPTGAICLIGHVFDIPSLYYSFDGWSTAMAIHTGILFTLTGLCFVLFGTGKENEKMTPSTIKLRTKLLLLFLSISLIPIAVLATTNYVNAKVLLVQQITTHLDSLADNEKNKVESSIDHAFAILSIVSSRPILGQYLADYDKNPNGDLQKQMITQIQSSKDAYSKFRDISILNPNGVIIASTESKYLDSTHANDDFFVRSIDGKNYLDFFLDENNKPFLRLAAPIFLDNKIIGVMSITANQDMIYPVNDYGNIGKTGEIVFGKKTSTDDVLFVSPLRYSSTLQLNQTFSKEKSMAMHIALSGQEKILDTVDYRNVPVLVATGYIPVTNWGLGVKIDQAEAFAPLENVRNLIIFPTIFASILIVILSILFADTLLKPILRIRDASKDLVEGKFDVAKTIGKHGGITELTELEHSMLSAIKAVNLQKDEFAAMISHELKTPLVPISGYAELFLDGSLGHLTETQREKMQVIYDNSIRLTALVQDILDARKIGLGRLTLDMRVESIKEIAKKSMDVFRPIAEQKGIKLIDETQDISVKCDSERILQVLNNLISNAVKFVPAQLGIVSLSSRTENGSVVVSVKDNGIGIPKTKQGDLFKKFYQIDKSLTRKSGGTGLGLAISRGIIESHGGKIWVESEENSGTTVYFTLPRGDDK